MRRTDVHQTPSWRLGRAVESLSGMRSKNRVQGINHTNFTTTISRSKDIEAMSTNQTSSDVTSRQKVRNTATVFAERGCTSSMVARSTDKGVFDREAVVADAMLDWLKPLTEGVREGDASSSTPKETCLQKKCEDKTSLQTHHPRWSPIQEERHSGKRHPEQGRNLRFPCKRMSQRINSFPEGSQM